MKQKRYWLRGGITLIIVVGLSMLILFFLFPTPPEADAWARAFPVWEVPLYYGMFLWDIVTYYAHIYTNWLWDSQLGALFQWIIPISTYFIVGAILGWIYGKIKNRNKVIQ